MNDLCMLVSANCSTLHCLCTFCAVVIHSEASDSFISVLTIGSHLVFLLIVDAELNMAFNRTTPSTSPPYVSRISWWEATIT